MLETVREMEETKVDRRFTLKEYVLLSLGKPVYLEHRIRSGWSRALPHYAFKCPVHGVVVDYPHGYGERLECPVCRKKRNDYPSKEHAGL